MRALFMTWSDTNALDNFRLNYLFYYLSFSLVFSLCDHRLDINSSRFPQSTLYAFKSFAHILPVIDRKNEAWNRGNFGVFQINKRCDI